MGSSSERITGLHRDGHSFHNYAAVLQALHDYLKTMIDVEVLRESLNLVRSEITLIADISTSSSAQRSGK